MDTQDQIQDQDEEEKLYVLMLLAEEQTKAVGQALAGLQAEREALARERQNLGKEFDFKVGQTLSTVADRAGGLIQHEAAPAIQALRNSTASLQTVQRRLGWQGLTLAAVATMSLVLSGVAVVYFLTWSGRVEAEKAQQEAAAWAAWKKAAIADCGGRLCIQVDPSNCWGAGQIKDFCMVKTK